MTPSPSTVLHQSCLLHCWWLHITPGHTEILPKTLLYQTFLHYNLRLTHTLWSCEMGCCTRVPLPVAQRSGLLTSAPFQSQLIFNFYLQFIRFKKKKEISRLFLLLLSHTSGFLACSTCYTPCSEREPSHQCPPLEIPAHASLLIYCSFCALHKPIKLITVKSTATHQNTSVSLVNPEF